MAETGHTGELLDDADGGAVEVSPPEGAERRLGPGDRVTFGRGPDVDVPFGAGDRWMSRRVGEIAVEPGGVRILNLSRKHVLLVRTGNLADPGSGEHPEPVRLRPRVPGEPAEACLLAAGSALIGSAVMLQERRGVLVRVPAAPAAEPFTHAPGGGSRSSTVARITLRPDTRGFMVALLLCEPWLRDPSRRSPLPSYPEIGAGALRVARAAHLLAAIERDPDRRDLLTGKIRDHLKALHRKLVSRRLLPDGKPAGAAAIAAALIHFDIIGRRHLALFEDDHWLEVQAYAWRRCM
ncbi:hypothetical protein [Spirillospora albida]|uniref:hypothetical protein n=1 Tax=Spirillospora albida TaxID=58123 RepID=UPI0004C23D87|nr:hypothetical protein [Spirillospora albida]